MRTWHGRVLVIGTAVVAALTASFAWWDPFVLDDRANLREMTSQSARSIRADLASDVRAPVRAQADTATVLGRPDVSRQDWDRAAEHFLSHYPSFLLIAWVEPTCTVRWITRRDAGGRLADGVGERSEVVAAVTRASHAPGDAVISETFEHEGGRRAAAVVVPITRNAQVDAFLVSVFDVRTLLDAVLIDHLHLGFGIAVLDGAREIYRTTDAGSSSEHQWAQDMPLAAEFPAAAAWRVRVWPDSHTLASTRSALPEVGVLLGALLAFAVLVTAHAAREQRSMTAALRDARDQLEVRVRERTAELQRANESLGDEVGVRRAAEESLRELSSRLLQLQDDERRRIARELHDSTAQTLAACSVSLEKARRLMRAGRNAETDDALGDAEGSVQAATSEIRTIAHLLHPPVLDDLGLAHALAWYAEGFSARSTITVHVAVPPDLERLPRDIELTLFRITQEALTNVYRHSGSQCARVRLTRRTGAIELEIQDAGRGIPSDILQPADGSPPRFGVGLAGMRERVRQLGGRIDITSTAAGTTIKTILPLPSAAPTAPLVVEQAD